MSEPQAILSRNTLVDHPRRSIVWSSGCTQTNAVNCQVNRAAVPFLDSKIVNGQDAKPGEIPYQVSLQVKLSAFHFCGGSVLNENYVITAAHCVVTKVASGIQVVAGTINLNVPSSTHNVAKIIVHQNYDPEDSWKNDIALLKVVEPFSETKLISFANLASSHDVISAKDVAVVSGWGRLWVRYNDTNI
ncbi:hypothetical protein M0802_015770 [Mischocyttarus mexicanus]|nr:hypothetical protein M0802_015770 [Mischocyttarus mexicanus]